MTAVARAALDAPPVPCHVLGPDLWFAEQSADVERAKAMCLECPIRAVCLAAALDRQEPWGVWGGEVFVKGVPVASKRGRGRPRVRRTTPAEAASREECVGCAA
ncbi:WhiB family transcriptional regulator [Mumia zhuanghuii]|uniref:Transcriptional regulator WhiB n=2 Tax=Mumia TaxID=1546255 RepID=A0ABW1QKZ2_9ACTN|nr:MULTISPECIES: WhiB family transcriptional regulator [Mumia]KAA1424941.1 WhiB family transcriptional regulator [Mumia zhuanghuii]